MKHELLKQEVERTIGRRLLVAHDYEELSALVFRHTKENLSPTTLKRLWGYLSNEKVATRRHTLDVLARFIGYRGYDDFCSHAGELDEVQSGICTEERIATEEMPRCQRLVITWRPDRRIMVKHLGDSMFEILEAENTKLSVGDTFRCRLMIQHEPLILDELRHEGLPPTTYVAGQKNGVRVVNG